MQVDPLMGKVMGPPGAQIGTLSLGTLRWTPQKANRQTLHGAPLSGTQRGSLQGNHKWTPQNEPLMGTPSFEPYNWGPVSVKPRPPREDHSWGLLY